VASTSRLYPAAKREARHGYSDKPYRVVRYVNGHKEVVSRHATKQEAERKSGLR
jgi:hypothetical protein